MIEKIQIGFVCIAGAFIYLSFVAFDIFCFVSAAYMANHPDPQIPPWQMPCAVGLILFCVLGFVVCEVLKNLSGFLKEHDIKFPKRSRVKI